MEEVMVFVNKIARIVHICVHAWEGAATKNLGESFLLTWLLKNDEDQAHLQVVGIENYPKMGELVDKALLSVIKTVAELRRAPDLMVYARHPKIIPKFGMEYCVGMTFGLHVGWAVCVFLFLIVFSNHHVIQSYLDNIR